MSGFRSDGRNEMKVRMLFVVVLFAAAALTAFSAVATADLSPATAAQPTVGQAPNAPSVLVADPYADGSEITTGTSATCQVCAGDCRVPFCSSGCRCKFCGGRYACNR
jgi:hypothetical protein